MADADLDPFAKYADDPFAKYATAQPAAPVPGGSQKSDVSAPYSLFGPVGDTVTQKKTDPVRHAGFAGQIGETLPVAPPQPGDETRDAEFTRSVPVGWAAGAARNVPGALQAIPGPIGDYATKFDAYLRTLGNPAANEFGNIAGAFIPGGGMLKGARALTGAAKYAPKVVEAAEGLAPAAKSLVERAASALSGKWGREAAAGGLAGIGSGITDPISKADPNAFDEKTKVEQPGYGERAKQKAETAAGRGAAGALIGGAPAIGGYLAERVGRGFNTWRGKPAELAEDALQKGLSEKAGEAAKSEAGKSIEVESRGSIAAADAERNKKIAQQVLDEHAARPRASKIDTGEELQGAALEMREKYHGIRKDQSGYNKMDEKYRDQPVVGTKQVVDKIDETLKTATDPGVISFLNRVKNRINSSDKTTFGIADNFRKDLRDAVSSGNVKMENGNLSSVGEETKALKGVHDALRKEIGAGVPEFEDVMKKYGDLSSPLDPFKKGGALFGVVTKDGLSKEFKQNPAPVVDKIMKAVKSGDDVLGKLAAENPELKTVMKDHLNERLLGTRENPKVLTTKQINDFNRDNKEILDSIGAKAEFDGLHDTRMAGEQAAESAVNSEKQVGELAKAKTEAAKRAEDYTKFQSKVDNLPIEGLSSRATAIADNLLTDKYIDQAGYDQILKEITRIKELHGQTEEAKKWVRRALIGAASGSGLLYGGAAVRTSIGAVGGH